MPVRVTCPACGVDGTDAANGLLARHFPNGPPAIPVATVAPSPPLNAPSVAAPVRLAVTVAPAPLNAARPVAPISPAAPSKPKVVTDDFSLGLGILGACVGAVIGAILVYAFYKSAGFRFPLSGVGIGICTGYGARLLGRGTDTSLGVICGAIALFTISATFYLMYGDFFLAGIISIVICTAVAYRVAS